jgi:hypothetical protein
MEVIVVAYAAVIVIHCFVGMSKMARWNNDPRQQQLVELLILDEDKKRVAHRDVCRNQSELVL